MIALSIDTAKQNLIKVQILKENKELICLEREQAFGSQVLLELIEKALKEVKLDFEDLNEVMVNPGPGSYTGLKVGASVAQALGLALNIPVNGNLNKPVELRYT